ncbi:response regulator transcription factor [Rahnella sp. SAP-1]|jgi:DNA-binding NarL/FixJ family response regulator|uniref:Response regulator transcription factor n=1 Tax=Rouxiella aceris TaxID=2703884 RepID=A0A848MI39_9GAMM|nr:LuxR C-terminal-related transcriptional regulator [Rouxiella aceris]NMP26986.1 response regulator transcription factor [Rouxiella aceris]
MKILIVEPCGFMRLGMFSLLIDHPQIDVMDVEDLAQSIDLASDFNPDIIFVNMTSHCHYTDVDPVINSFLNLRHTSTIYCYLDTSYPESDEPVMVADNFFIFKKQNISSILQQAIDLSGTPLPVKYSPVPFSLFSDQEILVMNYWMAEMPNYRIARKLNISDRTVYVHKRHITQKIKVRNRLEFCFIYNLIKYFYWPINPLAIRPLSRQTKSDILTLIR